jgi:hypothetical protein
VADGGLLERVLTAQRRLAGDVLLEVGVQAFIWLEPRSGSRFRAVGRQVENLDRKRQPMTAV